MGLRLRLLAIFAFTASLALTGFVAILVREHTEAESRRLDTDLRGIASRAAALMYADDAGVLRTDGVRQDRFGDLGVAVVVVEHPVHGADRTLVHLGPRIGDGDVLALARPEFTDTAELGRSGQVHLVGTATGDPVPAAAVPFWRDDTHLGGAVVVAAPSAVHWSGDTMLRPAAAAGSCLVLLLTALTQILLRRSMRPFEEMVAEREQFLSTAAHELRGPLARLRAGAEAALGATGAGDPGRRALRRLVRLTDDTGRVVANLLLAARTGHGTVRVERTDVDLVELAGFVESAFPDALVELDEPVHVPADAGLLRHAVTNLVDNAYRHGATGTRLPAVTVTITRTGDRVTIRVADDGPGFPSGADPSARPVTGPTSGTGLGLPLVRWIVERHGGHLRCGTSTGAWVEFDLPGATVRSERGPGIAPDVRRGAPDTSSARLVPDGPLRKPGG